MPSPFPGMDPWLEEEEVFPDFHERLLVHISEVLNVRMPTGYIATIKNLVWTDDVQRRELDVSLLSRKPKPRWADVTTVATLPGLAELGVPDVPPDVEMPYLEILSPTGKRLVTAIEILSLSNKTTGNGRQAYLDKQEEYRLGGVNIVEIDLLRGGLHTVATPRRRFELHFSFAFSYLVSVWLAGPRERYLGTAIALEQPLPTISIPLDQNVQPVAVELQPLLDRVYDAGRYSDLANYRKTLSPPLTPDQHVWAQQILKTHGQ
jgi:hypothetical protein